MRLFDFELRKWYHLESLFDFLVGPTVEDFARSLRRRNALPILVNMVELASPSSSATAANALRKRRKFTTCAAGENMFAGCLQDVRV